jgi:hypothetical protein
VSKCVRLVVSLSLLFLALVVSAIPVQFTPGIGVSTSTQNPLQIAILHWYDANLTTTFGVGTSPNDVAFDGSSVWVTNEADNTVTKLRASDGTLVGTFSAGGTTPTFLAYDGANTWVSSKGGNYVIKLRGSDGSLLGTFSVGISPPGRGI